MLALGQVLGQGQVLALAHPLRAWVQEYHRLKVWVKVRVWESVLAGLRSRG